MVRTRTPRADATPGTWEDVRDEAARMSRRHGALLANALEKVFVEHAYVLQVYWNSDMAHKLLEAELIHITVESIRSRFAEHLDRWGQLEAKQREQDERQAQTAERLLGPEEGSDG